jgi:hypothetical protein
MLYYYIIAFIVAIILVYASLYFIHREDIVLHQTNVYNFDFSLLYNKQPIIIEDSVKEIDTLLLSWFSPNIISKYLIINEIWKKNNYKYTIIYSIKDTEITLSHPYNNLDNYDTENPLFPLTTIKLKNNKLIIIPFKWKYNVLDTNDVIVYGIHDYITYLLDVFRIAI